ncbi:hypothetical protein AV540_25200 [Brevibacillus parabrevis]|uniref:aspartyl-phosphate phosphatase Spo0E family protein n=1 Tax=Brevibacillus parabrevis TaxID=54914 RepID=UPI0007AC2405|nr:aspartyl-phosphate phosphatase Spo0E family protein [Brevibacillus parabrevis]KZE43359.1 hypothetical protein AV540_25200 [Brevibacillus parabrevis]
MIQVKKKRKNETDLLLIIEELRGQLVQLAQEKGLDHIEVVNLSQCLDEYIVQFQSRMNAK